jgi:hypothetical protein
MVGRRAGFLPSDPPARTLCWSILINTAGTGVYLASSALFFIRWIGMSEAEVGLGLSVAGLVGLLAGPPIGALADRSDGRAVYIGTLLAESVSMAALVFARTFVEFVAVATVVSLSATASAAASGSLTRRTVTAEGPRFRARSRSMANLGLGFGGCICGWAIADGARWVYPALVLGNAASFAVCGAVVARLPSTPPLGRGTDSSRRIPFRDRPFLAIAGIYGVMMLQLPILTLVLPLWIAGHSHVPRVCVAALLPVNTLLVAMFQARFSRGVDTPSAAGRAMPRAGMLLLAGLSLMALVRFPAAGPAVCLLAVSLAVFTAGEIVFTAAAMELFFELPPADAQGRYLALFAMGSGIARAAGPAVTSLLCLSVGVTGWILFGCLLLGASLATPAATSRALKQRPAGG